MIRGSVPPFFDTIAADSVAFLHNGKVCGGSRCRTPGQSPGGASAATILPSTSVPMGMPKHSPRPARTRGGRSNHHMLLGILPAQPNTFAVSSFSGQRAGGTVRQCTVRRKYRRSRTRSRLKGDCRLPSANPRSLQPITPTPWFLAGSHAAAAQHTLGVVAHQMSAQNPRSRGFISATSGTEPHSHAELAGTEPAAHSCRCARQVRQFRSDGWTASAPGSSSGPCQHLFGCVGQHLHALIDGVHAGRRPGPLHPLTSTTQIRQAPISLISFR